jgi:peptide deformylase
LAIVPVLRYPHPALKQRARTPADADDAERVARDLVDTMRAHPRCVGLAANQIGVLARIVVVDVTGHPKARDPRGLLVLVDPVVLESAGKEVGREGCLSVPDFTGNVRRARRIVVRATTAGGSPLSLEARGFEARALQHEIDHLDGILFLDRVVSAADLFERRDYG